MTTPNNVYLLSEDRPLRDYLGQLLEAVRLNVAAFESAQDFMDRYDRAWHGCIVLDIRMPGHHGLKLQQHRQAVKCTLPIVFVSGDHHVPVGLEVLRGHDFQVFKEPLDAPALVDCVVQALRWYEEHVASEEQHRRVRQICDAMTRREQDVMQRMARGLTAKQMAKELGLSPRTVEIYRSHVLEKLGANSVADVVRLSLLIAQE